MKNKNRKYILVWLKNKNLFVKKNKNCFNILFSFKLKLSQILNNNNFQNQIKL